MRSILSPRSVSGVGASRPPLGRLSCKGSMDPKTKILAQNPRLCIQDRHVNGPLEIFASGDPLGCLQDRHVNGCLEKRPRLCIQDRHVNGPLGKGYKKWLPCYETIFV